MTPLADTIDTPAGSVSGLSLSGFGRPPEVSQAEAARLCKMSTATIRRHRAELQKHGAHPDPAGGWLIPIPALVATGLLTGPHVARSLVDSCSAAAAANSTTRRYVGHAVRERLAGGKLSRRAVGQQQNRNAVATAIRTVLDRC